MAKCLNSSAATLFSSYTASGYSSQVFPGCVPLPGCAILHLKLLLHPEKLNGADPGISSRAQNPLHLGESEALVRWAFLLPLDCLCFCRVSLLSSQFVNVYSCLSLKGWVCHQPPVPEPSFSSSSMEKSHPLIIPNRPGGQPIGLSRFLPSRKPNGP